MLIKYLILVTLITFLFSCAKKEGSDNSAGASSSGYTRTSTPTAITISVPSGMSRNLPIGMQIQAPQMQDQLVLNIAKAVSNKNNFHNNRPKKEE